MFWLWCQFSDSDMDFLEDLKSKVNLAFKGPSFEIHLTLLGPFVCMDSKNISDIRRTVESMRRIEVELTKYQYSHNPYTSLFIDVKKAPDLLSFRESLIKELSPKSGYTQEFEPHISLYYGSVAAEKKIEVITKLPAICRSCEMTKICIVSVNENLERWKIIERIHLLM